MNETELFFNAIKNGKANHVKELIERTPGLVNIKDARGFSPLIFATYFDKKDCVEALLRFKTEVDATDVSGNTALLGVAFKGNTDLALLLIKKGANINTKNNLGITPLIFATMYNQTDMVALLLKHKVDKTIMNKEGKIAMDYAKEKGFKAIEKLLT